MKEFEREKLRRELDEILLAFRLAKRRRVGGEGWLKNIRMAVGIPVEEVARRLGVCRWDIRRLELAEKESRIKLETLKRAAKALGCELVYALAPMEGTLEDLADKQNEVREKVRLQREEDRVAKRKPWLEAIGWREVLLMSLRTWLRKEGVRVRPRKTERGVAEQEANFKVIFELAKVTEKMGPVGGEAAKDRE
jgi:transcriptional regulator with XRE-family HTH domain